MKIHPDEAHAWALPSGAQTQRETNKNLIEAPFGEIRRRDGGTIQSQ